jgi:hypothetical protein
LLDAERRQHAVHRTKLLRGWFFLEDLVKLLPVFKVVLPAQEGDIDRLVGHVQEGETRWVGSLRERVNFDPPLRVESAFHVTDCRQRAGRQINQVRL